MWFHCTQQELDDVSDVWNSHRIRPSRNDAVPAGRPLVMYSLPSVYGARDYIQPVDPETVRLCREECSFISADVSCDADVHALCSLYMTRHNWVMPVDHLLGAELYLNLRTCFYQDL